MTEVDRARIHQAGRNVERRAPQSRLSLLHHGPSKARNAARAQGAPQRAFARLLTACAHSPNRCLDPCDDDYHKCVGSWQVLIDAGWSTIGVQLAWGLWMICRLAGD